MARHAQRGWASTIDGAQGSIDGAQGSTADIGILLVRAGMDREHLYVGTTRGRHANHAHVAPDPVDDDHHLGPPPEALTHETARKLLAGCLARVGGQEAAHTLLDQTQRTRPRPGPIAAAVRRVPEPEHQQDRYREALRIYQDRSRDRENLARDVLLLRGRVSITEQELRELPRLRRRARRTDLTTRLETDRRQLDAALDRLQQLDGELHTLNGTLDNLRAEAARDRWRLQTTNTRPVERTPQPVPRRQAPAQPDAYRRLPPPVAQPNERGLGIGL